MKEIGQIKSQIVKSEKIIAQEIEEREILIAKY